MALAFAADGTLSVYRDGELAFSAANAVSSGFVSSNAAILLGSDGEDGGPAATGVAVDRLSVWPFAMDQGGVAAVACGGRIW